MIHRRRLYFAMMMVSLVMPAVSFASSEVPESCPVTLPPVPAFIPPSPYPPAPPNNVGFWHGTSGLWTRLSSDGLWAGPRSASTLVPNEIATRNKLFWWSPGYHPMWTPSTLKVTGRRLDAEAPALPQPWVTNAHVPEWGGWTMLIMLELPTLGCWEVTGSYGADTISFVVWVVPPPPRA